GAVRPGGGGDQDVPHRRERGLPAEAGPVPRAARPALEIGRGLLWQAGRPAGPGDRLRLAAGACAITPPFGRADGEGRRPGGGVGGAEGGAGGAGGAGGGAGGRRRGDGGRRPQPDRGGPAAGSDGEDG